MSSSIVHSVIAEAMLGAFGAVRPAAFAGGIVAVGLDYYCPADHLRGYSWGDCYYCPILLPLVAAHAALTAVGPR